MKTTGLKRITSDKFYTISSIVDFCIKAISETISIGINDHCIEPSAGNGAFINGIKSLFTVYNFYDIAPEHDEIKELDYLNFDYKQLDLISNTKFPII